MVTDSLTMQCVVHRVGVDKLPWPFTATELKVGLYNRSGHALIYIKGPTPSSLTKR